MIDLPPGVQATGGEGVRRINVKYSILICLVLADYFQAVPMHECNSIFKPVYLPNPTCQCPGIPARTQASAILPLFYQSGTGSHNATALDTVPNDRLKS